MELPDDLTVHEKRVVEDAYAGRVTALDLPRNLEDPASWVAVRATVLVALLLNPEKPLTSKGLRVQQARIEGPLDFLHAGLTAPLHLEDCLFLEKVIFTDASCPALALPQSTFKNGLDAPRSRIDSTLNLPNTKITGQLNLESVFVRVDPHLEGAPLAPSPALADTIDDTPSVLDANSAEIGGGLYLTLRVEEILVEVEGKLIWSVPKTRMSIRKVSLPSFLVDELAAYVAGQTAESLVFTSPEEKPLRRANWRQRFWLPAVAASVGEPCRFHDLRHTHAALMIAEGTHPKVLQARLGYASAKTTLDVYGHLLDGADVAVVETLGSVRQDETTDL